MPAKKKSVTAAKTAAAPAKKAPAKKAAVKSAKPAAKAAAPPAPAPAPVKTAAKKAARKTPVKAAAAPVPATSLPPVSVKPAKKAAKPSARTTKSPSGVPGMELALAIADAADMKKAEHVRVLDVRGLSMVTDFLVIASGSSAPHLRAIRNEVSERIREDRKEKPYSTQGESESQWLLLDYGDVVVHLFQEEKRELYALEELWSDAPRLDWAPRF